MKQMPGAQPRQSSDADRHLACNTPAQPRGGVQGGEEHNAGRTDLVPLGEQVWQCARVGVRVCDPRIWIYARQFDLLAARKPERPEAEQALGVTEAEGFDTPYKVPYFVLTRTARPTVEQDGVPFVFVYEGIAQAVVQAQAAASDKLVCVAGGAAAAQQLLNAGLIDEVQIHGVSRFLGAGLSLFDQLAPMQLEADTRAGVTRCHAPAFPGGQVRSEQRT